MSETERAAWCKANKQHYPYVDKGPIAPWELQRIGQLLEGHPYRFAKTMPKTPHWYTLRYEWMDVGQRGLQRRWCERSGSTATPSGLGRSPGGMLDVGGFKYWSVLH